MKKKAFLRTLFLVTLIGINLNTFAYTFESGGIFYDIQDGYAFVTYENNNFNSYSGTVSIPATVEDNGITYTVKKIGDSAFKNCSGLTAVTFPDGLKSIGNSSFEKCEALQSVIFPDGIEYIGNMAFSHCHALTTVHLPESITKTGYSAFSACWNLTSVIISKNLTRLRDGVFSGCRSLTTIHIPNGVKTIESWAFHGCTNLSELSIPASVDSIGGRSFYNCPNIKNLFWDSNLPPRDALEESGCNLESITIGKNASFRFLALDGWRYAIINNSYLSSIKVEEGNPKYDSRNDCNALIETATNKLLIGCANTIIPKDVVSLGKRAFFGVYNLTSITIPNNVTTIEDGAFTSCKNLTSISLSANMKAIGTSTFVECTSLTDVTIPEGIIEIKPGAFSRCFSLETIDLPNSLQSIGSEAFREDSALVSITLPPNVTTIGTAAFWRCTSLADVNFLSKVKTIEKYTFCDCPSLTSITLPASVTEICDYAFSYTPNLMEIILKSNPKIGNLNTKAKLILSLDDTEISDFASNANTYSQATWSRTLDEGKYGTIVCPFALSSQSKSDYVFYELAACEDDGLIFQKVSNPQPGVPYLYKNANGKKADQLTSIKKVTVTTSINSPAAVGNWQMKGTYEPIFIDNKNDLKSVYFISNNKVMNATTDVTIAPLRAYFEGPSSAHSPVFSIRTSDGNTTLVDVQTMEEMSHTRYDLSGRNMNATEKGIYIMNGKKYLVK